MGQPVLGRTSLKGVINTRQQPLSWRVGSGDAAAVSRPLWTGSERAVELARPAVASPRETRVE
jgi:hypothetical protein